jgi:hypothetical protein
MKKRPSQPYPLDAEDITRIRRNILQMAGANAAAIPAVRCYVYAMECGMALAMAYPAIAAEALEALLTLDVPPLPFEPESAYHVRCQQIRARQADVLRERIERGRD